MLPVTCSFILALYLYLSFMSKMKVSAMPVRFKTCGNSGSVQSLELSPCSQQPCVFHHGINATVGLNFTSGLASKSLKTEVFGIIGGVPISFPMSNPDACTGCGVTCPIESGSSYFYRNILPVLKQYPSLQVVVKWQLVAENNDIVACVLFPIAIKSGDSRPLPEFNPEPDYTKEVPTFHNQEPEFHKPESVFHEPEPEFHKPKPVFHKPELVFHEPEPEFHKPKPVFHKPVPVFHEPKPEFHKPKPVFHKPELVFRKPKPEFHKPMP